MACPSAEGNGGEGLQRICRAACVFDVRISRGARAPWARLGARPVTIRACAAGIPLLIVTRRRRRLHPSSRATEGDRVPIAYWCILIAGLFPYLVVALAKRSGDGYDNADPRNLDNLLDGSRYRAHMAHLNSFEAFGFFAISVIVGCQLNGGPHPVIDFLGRAVGDEPGAVRGRLSGRPADPSHQRLVGGFHPQPRHLHLQPVGAAGPAIAARRPPPRPAHFPG